MSLRYYGLVFAGIVALTAIVGAWSGDATLAGAWRLPLALLLLGLAYEGWTTSRARMRATTASDQIPTLGGETLVMFELTHRLPRSLLLEAAFDAPPAVEARGATSTLLVPADGAAHLTVRVVPRRLGAHRWPDLRVRIAGPLGLAWWSRRLPVQLTLRAVPDMLRGEMQQLGALAGGVRSRAALGAGLEVLQLRDYRPGDALHLIDWKATVRSGRLVSRDFAEDQHLDIVVAVDAGIGSAVRAGTLDRLGYFANIAARLAEYAVSQDDRVGIVLFADRPLAALPPARGSGAVQRIRKVLETATASPAESSPLNAALRIRALCPHRALVVLLTQLDDATTAGQLASAVRLLSPKHLPIVAGLSSPEIEALAHAPARTWLNPYESLAAQEYSIQLERNVRALCTLGAAALVAHPDRLERAVFNRYADLRRRRRV